MPRDVIKGGDIMTEALLKDVKGIGPKSLTLLNKININTIEDLVTHYPFRYDVLKRDDLSKVEDGEKIIIDGKVESVPIPYCIDQKVHLDLSIS